MRHGRHVSEAAFIVRLWEASLETLAKQIANQPGDSFDHRGVRHGFWWDEDKMKHIARDASTPNLFLLLFALLCLLHFVPLHHETLPDVRGPCTPRRTLG